MIEYATTYFPLFVDLNQKSVLIFGGGKVATRRIISLLDFGVDIKVIAPECTKEVMILAEENKLVLEQRSYLRGEVENPYMVLAATKNNEINEEIYTECKEKGILVNVASDQTKSDFFFPGIVVENPLVIGITASGKDHKKVKKIIQKIRDMLKEENK